MKTAARTHPKTRACAACHLGCCGNRFASRITGQTGIGQRMRRYVRHADRTKVLKEVQEQLDEVQLDWDAAVDEMIEVLF